MRPLIFLACLVPGLAMVASAQDVDPKRLPTAKRALDKAEATILRNRKAYDEANEKAWGKRKKSC